MNEAIEQLNKEFWRNQASLKAQNKTIGEMNQGELDNFILTGVRSLDILASIAKITEDENDESITQTTHRMELSKRS